MVEESLAGRVLTWACDRSERVAGYNPWEVAVRLWRSAADDRLTGLAAEMAFFALLSLVPLIVAVGAGLGYLERFVGTDKLANAEAVVVQFLAVVFRPDTAREVFAPLVSGLLSQQRTGLALGSLLVTAFLASRVFTATIRALDQAYGVDEGRGALAQRGVAVVLAFAAVIVFVLTLAFMVVGPLLGSGQVLAERLGLGEVFAFLWSVGRWPMLVVFIVGFLAFVYRIGPHIDHAWQQSLPGAVLGVVLWILVSLGFRLYLEAGGPQTPQFGQEEEALAAAGRLVGAFVATILWIYLSCVAILVGGELNAELVTIRAEDDR